MKTVLRPFASFYLLALLSTVASATAAERVALDWAGVPAGEAPPPRLESTVIGVKEAAQALVVDGKTSPASPFPNGAPGLYFSAPEEKLVDVTAGLGTTGVLKGWVEMDLVLEDKSLVITLVQRANVSSEPKAFRIDGRPVAYILARSSQPMVIWPAGDESGKIRVASNLQENVPNKLKVNWDFTVTPPVLTFEVNGEPTMDKKGQPASLALPKADPGAGIDFLRIAPIKGFLGNIRVSE